jgi:uncharacterized membrane protein HdeD (DUF308 family)
MKTIRAAKYGYIISSIIFCAAGILFMAFPKFQIAHFSMIMGVLLAVYGVIKLIGYFSKDLYHLAFQFDLALGLLFTIIGIILLRPGGINTFLDYVIGLVIFTDGLFKFQIAIDAKRFGLNKWWIIMAATVIVCSFGLFLILKAMENTSINMRLIGSTLLSEGILNLCVAVYTVKILREKLPNQRE